VFNVSGEVVGVNTAIFSPNGGNIGIGFAIPANQAKEIIADLKENGSVERGWLGVQIQDLDDEIVRSLRMNSDDGALVADVVSGGPAEEAGLEVGDVITRFDGHDIDSARTLSRMVASANPSESTDVTVWRDGRSREITVKLGQAENEVVASNGRGPGANAPANAALGLSLRGLTDNDRAMLGLPSGVKGAVVASVEPGSPAEEKGLRAGDVITSVNQQAVDNVGDAVTALNSAKSNDETALLVVRRGDSQRFVALSFS
jgi:serine protease Do